MARFPVYQTSQVPSGSVRGVSETGAPDVSGLVRGLNIRAAEQEQERARLEHNEAVSYVTNASSKARADWTEQLVNGSIEQPEGLTQRLLKDWDAYADKAEKDAPERAKPLLKQRMIEMRSTLHDKAFSLETKARQDKLSSDFFTGLEDDARLIYADPSEFSDRLANRIAAAKTLVVPPAQREAMALKAREQLSFAAASVAVDRDPAEWLSRKKEDPVRSVMDPRQLMSMDDHARARLAQAQSRAQAGRDQAVKESVKALDDLSEFVREGGVVSPEYEARILPILSAQPGLAETASAMVAISRQGAGYGSQSIPRQKAALAAFTPGDPEQAKLKAHMQSITAKQEAAYKDNPWAAASRFGRVQESPPATLQSADQIPELVAGRLQSIGMVETLSGGAVSPIRPEEATQVQQLLSALPVERRGAVMGELGQMLTPDRIAKLAEQLDKGDKPTALMLQAAGDRTSEGVHLAVRIGQGAQYLKDKTIKPENETVTGWRAELSTMIRGTLGDAAQEQQAIDAAYYVRAAMEAEGYGMKASNELAARLVVGTILDRGGEKTTLPRGMTLDQFNEGLRTNTPDVLRGKGKLFLRGQEVTPEWVSTRLPVMGMKRDSQGRFVPFYNGAAITAGDSLTPLTLEVR